MMPSDPRALFAPLRAVLFDLDGTLVETHIDFPAMTQAMRDLALSVGVSPNIVDGKDILGMVDAAAQDVTHRGGDGVALRRRAFSLLEDMEVAGCARPSLLPGARELLTALRAQDRRVGVVTRNCRRVALALLTQFDLPHDVLLTRDDVRLAKPNPEHLWEALAALGCSRGESAMVGDHWMDVQAGYAAGCAATLGVLGTHDANWFAPCPPTALAADLRDAMPLFGRGDG